MNLSSLSLRQYAAALLLLPIVAAQQTFDLEWTVPSDGGPLPPMTVFVGDTVRFNYGTDQPHDVFIHPNNTCEMQRDRIRVKGTQGPGIYTFTEPGTLFFCCDQGGHCERGLNIRIRAVPRQGDGIDGDDDEGADGSNGGASASASGGSSESNGGSESVASTNAPTIATVLLMTISAFAFPFHGL